MYHAPFVFAELAGGASLRQTGWCSNVHVSEPRVLVLVGGVEAAAHGAGDTGMQGSHWFAVAFSIEPSL
jgi:hypothetical protein